ncbi:uncharacterized protein LOC129987468 [Argiope bruennichi]|uniref:uncharacterized protein LOC129987468 n=1 Tax=Argiope bruennichi TaxID=94029 RepID=UPI002493F6DC|nr:uncharacterized protein LOC129987468 [Argiope bruennichi]
MAIENLANKIEEGKSRKHHVLFLSIDIKGAFDNIQHNNIINYLQNTTTPTNIKQMFEDLLKNRKVVLNTAEGPAVRAQRQGCPQGSCSGPALWNLVSNDILQQDWPENTTIQAFADDFAIVTHAPTKKAIEDQTHSAIRKFQNWANKNSLKISTNKTNFILFSKLVKGPSIKWNGNNIKRKHAIKYLGLQIDDKLNWNAHLRYQATRAAILHQNLLKIAGNSWGIKKSHRKTLYLTVIERMLAHGAVIWCQDPTERMKRKLAAIQRPFLLAISGAYRTTSTAALQTILGIPPLHLQLQREAKGISLYRLHHNNNCLNLDPDKVDSKITGWTSHPSVHLQDRQISLEDGGSFFEINGIYTDGSKTEKGVGAAFCVFQNGYPTTAWTSKLAEYNTVFQAEILALYKAVNYIQSTSTPTTIYVDNKASIQAAANPKSKNWKAREIFKTLASNPNINISWIKAHTGHAGNESADLQAKQAAESEQDIQPEPYPISYVKSTLRQAMMVKWQREWDLGDTGRNIHLLIPKVTLQLTPWRREEILFFTGHGPFPTYLKRFNLAADNLCTCGEVGSPLHFATECILTSSFHLRKPSENLIQEWLSRVAGNPLSRLKISKLVRFLHEESALFHH